MSPESTAPHGEVFLDPRGNGRALRLTWHHEADVVVLSLWRERLCVGTFRLSKSDVNDFIDALVDGLRDSNETVGSQRPTVDTGEVHFGTPHVPIDPVPMQTDEAPAHGLTDWAFDDDPNRATA